MPNVFPGSTDHPNIHPDPKQFGLALAILVLGIGIVSLYPQELPNLFVFAIVPLAAISYLTGPWVAAALALAVLGVQWWAEGGTPLGRLAVEALSLVIFVHGAARAKRLYQASTRLRELVEHSTNGIVLVDLRTLKIIDVNQAICTLLDHPREQLLGLSPLDILIVPTDAQDLAAHLTQIDDTPGHYESRLLRARAGHTIPVDLSSRHHTHHGLDAVTLSFRDQRQRRALQDQLVDAERDRVRASMETGLLRANRLAQVGTLAAGVAHEINNPLAFVQSNLDFSLRILKQPGSLASDDRVDIIEALKDAITGGERIGNVTKQLKIFAHDEDQPARAVDLREVCEVSARMVEHRLPPDTSLKLELDNVPLVLADEGRMAQVVMNLLINATHAIEDVSRKGVITLSLSQQANGDVILDISDNGTGIPDKALAEVFDPFFTTKPVGEGTGLGLSVSQGIVQGFSGVISIYDTSEFGTTMRVVLPHMADAPDPDTYNTTPPTAAPHADMHLLLVDDEAALRRALSRSLGRRYRVTVCDGPLAALDAMHKNDAIDAVLCDLIMPVMTGEELQRAVRAFDPDLASRFVFMTGGAFTQETRAFADHLGDRLLNKPFGLAEVRLALAYLLDEQETR